MRNDKKTCAYLFLFLCSLIVVLVVKTCGDVIITKKKEVQDEPRECHVEDTMLLRQYKGKSNSSLFCFYCCTSDIMYSLWKSWWSFRGGRMIV